MLRINSIPEPGSCSFEDVSRPVNGGQHNQSLAGLGPTAQSPRTSCTPVGMQT